MTRSIVVDAENNLYQSKLELAQLLNVDSEILLRIFKSPRNWKNINYQLRKLMKPL